MDELDPSSSKITWEYYYKGKKLDFKSNPYQELYEKDKESFEELRDKREEECKKIDKNYMKSFSQRFFIDGIPFNGNTCTGSTENYRVRNFIDGYIEGDYLDYRDGVLRGKGQFSKSCREGRWESYINTDYEKKTNELEGFTNYKNGLRDGLLVSGLNEPKREYDIVYRDSAYYKNDVRHGRYARWSKIFGGKLIPISIENFIDGELDGEQIYYEDGVIYKNSIYEKGTRVEEKFY